MVAFLSLSTTSPLSSSVNAGGGCSSTRTKLSGKTPVRPVAISVPSHQPPSCTLMFVMMAPFFSVSSSGSLAA
uniref:Putative secreted protein n=1 Tax=Anopheles triannulatus TaxID=58253 RepID=A0A2M4B1P0_9DIPT